jgi:glutamine synthetase
MKRVALRHGLVCLTHEKPFAGINGNGKHCNWSMSNDKGENLLDPGSTPHQNLRFLAVTAVVMKAVHEHSDALRASIASPGNDHRLGGNEAPPAIISVFLGSLLAKICDDIESGKASAATETQILELGVSHIPNISRDYTDRNRTSPFAFTGNKFEFRAVGGSANVAVPVATLNAAVASTMMDATERLKELLGKKGRDEAVMELIREYLKASRPVRFEGNNYSAEWQAEAKKRGLPVLNSTAEALQVFNQAKSVEFLQKTKVLTKDEIHSRYHVWVERYNKTLLIEHYTLAELVSTHVIPAVEAQLRRCATTAAVLTTPAAKSGMQKRAGALETTYTEILGQLETLKGTLDKVAGLTDETEAMKYIASDVTPAAKKLRQAADSAESQVADELWPLPKYREMLFAFALS